ncbi:hypothetical protein HYH03_004092 [Edaphochlamys debaryana]|uniref:Uncharacterized protein n=1 Tax=Edaphochlamys debaryana TaxID=47281 RepID=A0A835Y7R0_9CHLO|nr:hypothetical protein HYH03_004092 [Edaphochlamys debaryana]|eukprot:KAG2497822.1 hypothetical protein HYH03_004092 [Edaphochlamys debaryana]
MASFLGRRRRPCTPPQRVAGVTLALFVLIQAPLFRFLVEYTDGTIRQDNWSPVEVVAVGLLKTNPDSEPYVPYLLLPGVWFKELTLVVDSCYVNHVESECKWSRLQDIQALLPRCDYKDKVPIWEEKIGWWRQMVQATAGMALVCSLMAFMLDTSVGLIGGWGGLIWMAAKAGCEVIPMTTVCVACMVATYVMLGPNGALPAPGAPGAAAAAGDRKPEAAAAGAPAVEPKKTK